MVFDSHLQRDTSMCTVSAPGEKPFFSIVIPAHNEEDVIEQTCVSIVEELSRGGISDVEVLVVNDNSADATEAILQRLCARYSCIRYLNNPPPHGFGFAVRCGLEQFRGDAVAVVMADLSDSPKDIRVYYDKIREGHECVFGSRFIKGSHVVDYPKFKLVINRAANFFVRKLFGLKYNDVTNAFKAYRREVIDGVQPVVSQHFNLTVELPLKAIVRGYQYTVPPISWTNRAAGRSKLKLQEMGSRYLFIVLYVLFEKLLSRGDYHRVTHEQRLAARAAHSTEQVAQAIVSIAEYDSR